jgi:uncharacterized protein (PEP-CTERM system associated)
LTWAGEWRITPSLSLSERYSDNIGLDTSGASESSFVTEVTPSLRAVRQGGRLKVNLDYGLQSLLYSGGNDRSNINHRLNGSLNAELSDNFLFLDANARMSQQYRTLTGGLGVDNINGTNNLATVGSYSVSPYIRTRLGSYANLDLRLTHDNVLFESSGASDSSSNGLNFALSSGPQFLPLSWGTSYSLNKIINKTGADSDSENAAINARYQISRKFGLLAHANLERNDFQNAAGQAATGRLKDFSYWGGGFYYQPGRRFSADVAYNSSDYGGFVSGNLTFKPTLRTSLNASTTQRSFGRTYGMGFTHYTRKTAWSLQYREDLTTVRQLQLTPVPLLDVYDCGGTPTIVPVGTPPPSPTCVLAGQLGTLGSTDIEGTFVSKSMTGAVSYRMRKSSLTLSLFDSERTAQLAGGSNDHTQGLQLAFSLMPGSRSTVSLATGLSTVESSAASSQDDLWNLSLSVSHTFQPKVSGSLELRHQQRSSDTTGQDYAENSLAARLNMTF